jgi:hypothetical protein
MFQLAVLNASIRLKFAEVIDEIPRSKNLNAHAFAFLFNSDVTR